MIQASGQSAAVSWAPVPGLPSAELRVADVVLLRAH
jgi:hypothetical protein